MKITGLLDRNKITIRRQHSEFARLANHLNAVCLMNLRTHY